MSILYDLLRMTRDSVGNSDEPSIDEKRIVNIWELREPSTDSEPWRQRYKREVLMKNLTSNDYDVLQGELNKLKLEVESMEAKHPGCLNINYYNPEITKAERRGEQDVVDHMRLARNGTQDMLLRIAELEDVLKLKEDVLKLQEAETERKRLREEVEQAYSATPEYKAYEKARYIEMKAWDDLKNTAEFKAYWDKTKEM